MYVVSMRGRISDVMTWMCSSLIFAALSMSYRREIVVEMMLQMDMRLNLPCCLLCIYREGNRADIRPLHIKQQAQQVG